MLLEEIRVLMVQHSEALDPAAFRGQRKVCLPGLNWAVFSALACLWSQECKLATSGQQEPKRTGWKILLKWWSRLCVKVRLCQRTGQAFKDVPDTTAEIALEEDPR